MSLLNDVHMQLILQVKTAYKNHNPLSDQLLSALNFVQQRPLLQAFDLVDRKNVTRVTCPAGRTVFQVCGSSGKLYTCFASSNFCSCPAYVFSVLKKKDVSMCKHVLAVELSCATGSCRDLSVSDEELTQMLLSNLATT
ncbi:zinc finger SWIM domain-containing protein 7-like [Anneissia japonica]|uniref:zinc finger SWIM domain-containing protein 7-like n=1 Tax=Anneissia japonica TaxID=1529436 RepID=UPI00142573AB|nr:zinc finger SWIM domain-containing protein 7-like [Anneissia japonica]XP_033123222.1 zinc finger SWIM domain-containing protein 7-like [Anneissia japonica]